MHGLLTLLPQIAVILVAARLMGGLFRGMGQPRVIGEIVAGIVLGPSLLGWLAPGAFAFLFPPESLDYLGVLSQLGLILFMFLVGLELDPGQLRGRGHTALVTSHASIVAPFFLGVALALYLYPRLSDGSVAFTHFALFLGAAMSVTAFPVLARILAERNLLATKVGVVTITCAAVDDVTAWCILAAVIALVRATGAEGVLFTLAGTVGFVGVLYAVVRPALRRLEAYYDSQGRMTQGTLAVVLVLLLASAWTTEWLGIHALFGAFAIGVIMPKDRDFVHDLTARLEDLTVLFLLPLFFAYAGLHTQIGLLSEGALWLDGLLILLVAVAGKFGGSSLAARLTGLSWREAGALGILMNTRGLMELVILTIGLELGVISPALFALMVLMALATTFMTTPVLEWIYPLRLIRQELIGGAVRSRAFTVLLPVSLPSSGQELLRVAQALAPPADLRIYALHLLRAERTFSAALLNTAPHEQEPLQRLLEHAGNVPVRPLAFVSRDVGADITAVAHDKDVDLVLMGWHKPVVSQSVLSGTVYEVMQHTRADVAVYLARQFRPWRRVLVPYAGGPHDRGALELARRIGTQTGADITILHVVPPARRTDDPRLGLSAEAHAFETDRVRLKVVEHDDPQEAAVEEALQGYDLVIIGASEVWGLEPTLFSSRHERLADATPASLLILRQYRPAAVEASAALVPT